LGGFTKKRGGRKPSGAVSLEFSRLVEIRKALVAERLQVEAACEIGAGLGEMDG